MAKATVETAAQRVVGMIGEGLVALRIPVLAEFSGDAQPAAPFAIERPQKDAEPLFGDSIRWRGIEVTDTGQVRKFEKFNDVAFGRNFGSNMPPRPPQPDNPQPQLDG